MINYFRQFFHGKLSRKVIGTLWKNWQIFFSVNFSQRRDDRIIKETVYAKLFLGPYRIFVMKPFCKYSGCLNVVNYFQEKKISRIGARQVPECTFTTYLSVNFHKDQLPRCFTQFLAVFLFVRPHNYRNVLRTLSGV